jgi:hypothetical protein
MVLLEQGSCQHVGQMFRGVPHEVFPHEQNQCSEGENFKLPANFTRIHPQSVREALGLCLSLPPPRVEDWLMLQNFYEGLTTMSKGTSMLLLEEHSSPSPSTMPQHSLRKIVANQSWGEERKTQKGMHTMKETDLLAAKLDLLMKRLDDCAPKKEATTSTV